VLPSTFRDPFERTPQPLHIVVVIPARYHSTRFPGKPLADIAGRSMIEHVYARASAAPGLNCDIVVNVQGDEPLIEPDMIAEVVEPLDSDAGLLMSTLRRQINDPADHDNPHVVKVVVDLEDNALYFSRSAVPFAGDASVPRFKHVGLYGYRRAFMSTLASLPRTPLEIAESLEQLRAIEHGFKIRATQTHHDSIGVDTPEDLERVRRQLAVGTRV
jgi:3-deoxy-manno-octulosonate cytidylyltransferase (CMP-KDO synthetase)